MSKSITALLTLIAACSISTVQAQVNAADSVMNHVKGNRLSIGGYGEVAYSRNFIATISFAIAVRNFMPKTLAMGGLIFRML